MGGTASKEPSNYSHTNRIRELDSDDEDEYQPNKKQRINKSDLRDQNMDGFIVTKDDKFFFGKTVFDQEHDFYDIIELENEIRKKDSNINSTFSLRDMCVLVNLNDITGPIINVIPLSDEYNHFISLLDHEQQLKLQQYQKNNVLQFLLKAKKFGMSSGPYILYSNRPKISLQSRRLHKDCIYNFILRNDISKLITENMRSDRYADFVFIQYQTDSCVSTTIEFVFESEPKTVRYTCCPGTTLAFNNTIINHTTPYEIKRLTSIDNTVGNKRVRESSSKIRYLARDLLQLITTDLYEKLKKRCTKPVFNPEELSKSLDKLSRINTLPIQTLTEYYSLSGEGRQEKLGQCGGNIKRKTKKRKTRKRKKKI
jgi:hypothetical protein